MKAISSGCGEPSLVRADSRRPAVLFGQAKALERGELCNGPTDAGSNGYLRLAGANKVADDLCAE